MTFTPLQRQKTRRLQRIIDSTDSDEQQFNVSYQGRDNKTGLLRGTTEDGGEVLFTQEDNAPLKQGQILAVTRPKHSSYGKGRVLNR